MDVMNREELLKGMGGGVQDEAVEKDKYDVNSAKGETQSDNTGGLGA